jgi:hypothetical protein
LTDRARVPRAITGYSEGCDIEQALRTLVEQAYPGFIEIIQSLMVQQPSAVCLRKIPRVKTPQR